MYPYSPYNYSAIVRVRGPNGELQEPPHLDIRPSIVRTKFSDNTDYTVAEGDNWSRIAWKMLGTGKLWWVIADFSDVLDPLSEIRIQEKLTYVAQLASPVNVGEVRILQLTDVRKIKKSSVLRVEDLTVGGRDSFDVSVLTIDKSANTVGVAPFELTGGSPFPSTLSRVSLVKREGTKLVVPSIRRAMFDALDFRNPYNTLTE